jgi:hypothetical protein
MNGRVYDYNVGRFLSVDPFVHGGSQVINPYSYLLNNPLAGTDPSGYTPQCDDVGEAFCGPFGYGDNCSFCVSTESSASVNGKDNAAEPAIRSVTREVVVVTTLTKLPITQQSFHIPQTLQN